MLQVLVAGGAGFIGSHLCKKLLEDNYTVVCVDSLITGNTRNIQEFFHNPNFTFLQYDITVPSLRAQLSQFNFQYIFHMASPASPSTKSPRSYIAFPVETLLANSIGTYNLLELGKSCNAGFLYASSSEIYGDPTVSPQPETYFGNVNPNGVRSVYDEAKRFGEAMTFAYVRKYNVNARIVRIFNTYGPNMQADDGRVVSNFINQALREEQITIYGDGTQTRSFCYVDDMVNALIKAMFAENTKGDVINLGNPDERTIQQLAQEIITLTKTKSSLTHELLPEDDPKVRKPDIQKAKRLLEWEPSVTLKEGLKKTIEYFSSL